MCISAVHEKLAITSSFHMQHRRCVIAMQWTHCTCETVTMSVGSATFKGRRSQFTGVAILDNDAGLIYRQNLFGKVALHCAQHSVKINDC